MSYTTFLPNYYGSLIRSQQQGLLLDNLFVYVADGVTQGAVANTVLKTIADEQKTINQIMYGVRLTPANAIALTRRVEYTPNKVYAMYDSKDPDLSHKDFYVLNSQRNVYKCLDNNGGALSLNEPTTVDTVPTKLTDGYIWQLMFSLTEEQLAVYGNSQYIPVFDDANVVADVIRGTVSFIGVVDGGNYPAINNGNILSVVSNTVFQIEPTAAAANGTYTGSSLYISAGPSEGSISKISDYYSNTSGRYVVVSTPLPDVSTTSAYEISPTIDIVGDGSGATARAIMGNSDNIDKVEVLNRGIGYTYATGNIVANNITSAGQVDIDLSPLRGHGADVYAEMYADTLLLNIDLDLLTLDIPMNDLRFSKVGLMRRLLQESNPSQLFTSSEFSNLAKIQASPVVGSFSNGDTINLAGTPELKATVVFANSSCVCAVYQHPGRFQINDSIVNQNGVSATISAIDQPDVKLLVADIVAQQNITTATRDENSRELIQITIQIK